MFLTMELLKPLQIYNSEKKERDCVNQQEIGVNQKRDSCKQKHKPKVTQR
jgi:hypothetical protein